MEDSSFGILPFSNAYSLKMRSSIPNFLLLSSLFVKHMHIGVKTASFGYFETVLKIVFLSKLNLA